MSHQIESMAYFGDTPWHSLGVKLDHPATAEEAIISSGLDWQVRKEPLFLAAYAGSMAVGQIIEDHYATIRSTDRAVLGVVGDRYQPLQNREAFGFFDYVVGQGAAVYHTAGSLSGGRRIWLLAKLPETIKVRGNDIVDQYLLLSNGHDGSTAVQIKLTPIRVVCNNTLSLALRDGHKVYSVRHTASVAEKIREVADLMGLARQAFAGTAEAYRRLAEIKVDARLLSEFFGILIPDNPDAERTSRTQNTRDRLIDLFENDWRNNLPETRHTLWSAYNAITHFVDHVRGSDDKRLQSAWFGSGAQLKDLAFTEALKLAA